MMKRDIENEVMITIKHLERDKVVPLEKPL